MLTYSQMASEVMWHLVTHDAHGYSQPHRSGDGTIEELILSDGTPVYIHGGDYDCSDAARMCYAAVGVLPEDAYMWTGNERELLLSNGFIEIDPSDAEDGDVLFTSGHTELCIDMDEQRIQAGFRHSENYGIDGEQGDQTGDEATWSYFNPDAWETAFRCIVVREVDGDGVIDNKEVIDMTDWAIVAFGPSADKQTGYLYAAGKLHPLANEEEQKFIEFVYGEARKQIDSGGMPHIVLGDGVDAPYGVGPWGEKLREILSR